MKYILCVLLFAFSILPLSLAGQNRYTKLEFSKRNQIKTPDLKSTLNTLDRAYKARYEKAIQDCYEMVIDSYREAVLEGEGDFEYIEPKQSSWIKRIEYYHSHRMPIQEYSKACILFTKDGSYYLYRMDDDTWARWEKAYSKGEFFSAYIRDNKDFSFRYFCERILEMK